MVVVKEEEFPPTTPWPILEHLDHYHPSSSAWNFSHWWQERNNEDENSQLYAETPVVVFDEPVNKSSSTSSSEPAHQYINTGAADHFDRFGQVQYKPHHLQHPHHDHLYPHAHVHQGGGVMVTSNPLEVDRFSSGGAFVPVTSVEVLNATIRQYFSLSRHWSDDRDYMRDLRESLKEKFLSYGLKTAFHVFKTEENHSKMVSQQYLILKLTFSFLLSHCTREPSGGRRPPTSSPSCRENTGARPPMRSSSSVPTTTR